MNSKEWLTKRTPEELLRHFALLRHTPQQDYMAHTHRRHVKEELERRAVNLSEFMTRLDESDG